MMVTDLQHFLDLSDEVPAPARRLAEQLSLIVRAATSGPASTSWQTALPCQRRPGRQACPGRIVVRYAAPTGPIDWHCSSCGDDGTISNWADSPFDLRRRQLIPVQPAESIVIGDQAASALRSLMLLDPDTERVVFGMHAHPQGAVLTATAQEFDELLGSVAAAANHEPNRRRQQELDSALDALSGVTTGW